MAVPAAGSERHDRLLITAAGRERVARWLFTRLSLLREVHWEHLGTSARMEWLDVTDDLIELLRE